MKLQVFFKVLCVVLLLALLLPGVGASRARGEPDTQPGGDFVPGEVLVKFRPGVTPVAVRGGVQTGMASLDALARQYGVTATEPLFAGVVDSAQGLERIYKLSLPRTADVLAVVAALSGDAYVEYAEPNYMYHILGEPDDPYFTYEWGLHNTRQTGGKEDADIDAPEAWDIQTEAGGKASDLMFEVAGLDSEEEQLVTLINEYRQQNDLGALSPSPTLTDAADWFAHDTYCGCHTDSLGRGITERVQAFGYPDWATEVIFNGSDGSAQTALNWWKSSPSHNAELLRGDISAIGIGRAYRPPSAVYDWVWVVDLGPVVDSADEPNDPYFTYEWGLHNTRQTGGKEDADIDAPEAWLIATGTTDVMVAVIDTGVDYNHEDLDDGRVRTDIDKDYVNNDDDAMDDHGHGTHVAGTIAAETNNGVGVAGVMWQAQLLPLKVCNSRGSCPVDAIASAIRYAADQGADVINMSLGGSCSQTIADAVNYAYFDIDKGVVIVAAAGNNGGSISYPAKHDPVIAVGATDHNDHKAYFSNFGDELDVVAPGVTIFSTVPSNGYDSFSGTSMASPHAAGVAGLLLAQRPDVSQGQVREILRQSADDLGESGFDRYYGYGRVNAHQALQTDTPDEPEVPERTECPPCVCGASVAVAGGSDEKSLLSNLRAVRDQVFTEDPGRRWVRIYYDHQFEVARLLMSDSQLRADALAGFRAFDPVFRAGLHAREASPPVILTPELIEAAERALMGVAKRGSPAVHDAIVREWDKVNPYRFVGWDVLEVWEQLRREERSNRIYLPLILRQSSP